MIKVETISLEEAAYHLLSLAREPHDTRGRKLEPFEDMIATIRSRQAFSEKIPSSTVRAWYAVDVGVLLDEVQRLRYELKKLRGVGAENDRGQETDRRRAKK